MLRVIAHLVRSPSRSRKFRSALIASSFEEVLRS
jgi:hypothetical protein